MAAIEPMPRDAGGATHRLLASLIDGIGGERFGPGLAALLDEHCGVDYCTVFRKAGDELQVLVFCSRDASWQAESMIDTYLAEAAWRQDPVISDAAMQSPATRLLRIEPGDERNLGYLALRARMFPRAGDRLALCGCRDDEHYCLSAVRDAARPAFEPGAAEHLARLSEVVLSAIAKHARPPVARRDAAAALLQLSEIERRISACGCLPPREAEVCARVVFGLTTVGISLDLGLSEESVKTYRKRAYRRLNVSCEGELMRWFLAR